MQGGSVAKELVDVANTALGAITDRHVYNSYKKIIISLFKIVLQQVARSWNLMSIARLGEKVNILSQGVLFKLNMWSKNEILTFSIK